MAPGLARGQPVPLEVCRGGGAHVFETINRMYLMSQMIVPGSTCRNLGIGLHKGEVGTIWKGWPTCVVSASPLPGSARPWRRARTPSPKT